MKRLATNFPFLLIAFFLIPSCKKENEMNSMSITMSLLDSLKVEQQGFDILQRIYTSTPTDEYRVINDTVEENDTLYNQQTVLRSRFDIDTSYFDFCLRDRLVYPTDREYPFLWIGYTGDCEFTHCIPYDSVDLFCFTRNIKIAPEGLITLKTGKYLARDVDNDSIAVELKLDTFYNSLGDFQILPVLFNFPNGCDKRVIQKGDWATNKFVLTGKDYILFEGCEPIFGEAKTVNDSLIIYYQEVIDNQLSSTHLSFKAKKIN